MSNNIVALFARATRVILKRWGSGELKRKAWDSEFRSGQWNYLERSGALTGSGRDAVLEVIERYSAGGDILDLGCGTGFTSLEINDGYATFLGVDISEVAVQKASAEVDRDAGKRSKTSFCAADIAAFIPERQFSVILFRESLYYIPAHKIETVLIRYALSLEPQGVFIVRLHDRIRYKKIVELIQTTFQIREQHVPEQGKTIVLVFAPNGRGE